MIHDLWLLLAVLLLLVLHRTHNQNQQKPIDQTNLIMIMRMTNPMIMIMTNLMIMMMKHLILIMKLTYEMMMTHLIMVMMTNIIMVKISMSRVR